MKTTLRCLAVISFVFFLNLNGFAQKYSFQDFNKVDSLANNAQPKTALALINKINIQARAEGNSALLIKSVIYSMLFQSYLEENAFDQIVLTLKQDIAAAKQPEKSILQSLLAETYWKYYQQNSYTFANRTAVDGDIGDDIKTWSIQKITAESIKMFLTSLNEKQLLQNTKIDLLNEVLAGDKIYRELRPTLYDLLANRAIDIFINTQITLTQAETDELDFNDPLWLGDQSSFLAATVSLNDSTSFDAETIRLFKELIRFHRKTGNKAALADIDLKRLKFIYQRNKNSELYNLALQDLANTAIGTDIYADILYEQAVIHFGGKLLADTNKLNLVKAVTLAKAAIKTKPSSIGAQNAGSLLKTIERKEVSFKLNGNLLPHQPAQLYISSKNVDTIYFKIYQDSIAKRKNYYNFKNREDFMLSFKNRAIVRSWTVILPKETDYQTHTLITKLDGLNLGSYTLIASDNKESENNTTYYHTYFQVTSLAVNDRSNTNNKEYFVTSSLNGAPINGAKIQQKNYSNINGETAITNESGFAVIKGNTDFPTSLVTYQKDSVLINSYYYNYSNNRYRNRIILFTDRPIYRPGQIVYYKGIYLETTVDKNNILPNENVTVSFKDANYKEIEKTDVTTNEYGTFQGSFNIPIGKLNGQMRLSTPYGSIAVQVEEYKRPTFEVIFDKSTQKYKLNDTIKVLGKAASFSAYAVEGAQVKYTVYSSRIQDFNRFNYQSPKQIAFGKTETGTGGKFEIAFLAKAANFTDNYSYDIKVEITDLNGETKTNHKLINVGKRDIQVSATIPAPLFLTAKTDSIPYTVVNLNGEPIKATLQTEWLLLEKPDRLTFNSPFTAERYSMNRNEFIKNFPFDEYNGENNTLKWPTKSSQLKQTFTTNGNGKISLNNSNLPAGYYKVNFTAINAQNDTATFNQVVRVYNNEPTLIQHENEWLVAEKNTIDKSESAIFRLASILPNSKIYYEVYHKFTVVEKVWLTASQMQQLIKIKPKPGFDKTFAVQFTMVQNGKIYNSLEFVNIIDDTKELEIKFLTFRNKLQPGEKENWKLSISNKEGEKQMAELVATLYDASLDDLSTLNWDTQLQNNFNYYNYNWQFSLNRLSESIELWRTNVNYYGKRRSYEYLNLFGFDYYGGYNSSYRNYIKKLSNVNKNGLSENAKKTLEQLAKGNLVYGVILDGDGYAVAGIPVKVGNQISTSNAYGIYSIAAKPGDELTASYIGFETIKIKVGKTKRLDLTLISDSHSLNEVVVTGYGLPGKGSMAKTARLESANFATDAQPTAVSGSSSLNGLLGKVAGMQVNDDGTVDVVAPSYQVNENGTMMNAIVPRTNFSETAFFYPQLHTNEKGEINIEFTIPQSLTRYKMMGFAHTKDLKTASISNELITQKQLAISANAPRFFREGDTIIFSTKLNNLSGTKLNGVAILELRDALTGKVISISTSKLQQNFELTNDANQVLKWPLIIPAGITAITYKILAQSGKYSDGEEMVIPVLPNSMLVTESMPISVRSGIKKTFKLEKLISSGSSKTMRNQALTFEFTSNPMWYAVQALPYLMEYPYECAEQTFSRFYANSFATGIINSSPKIKAVFNQWQNTNNGEALLSNLEKNQELKSILLEETPWVRNADNETDRKKRLAVLFDLNRMTYELKNNFEKLEKMQHTNGSFPWFTGMSEDRYITQHIVLGMGQLKKLNLIDVKNFPNFDQVLNKAIAYLDGRLIEDYKNVNGKKEANYLPLHYLYARSYHANNNKNTAFQQAFAYYLTQITASWKTMGPYQQAQAALVLHRNENNAEALKIIALLQQTAQQNEEMGMYWSANTNGWWWYQNPIETQSLLIEAFDEVAGDTKSVEEMKIWLLKNKQTNDWKTTKATAAACYALLMRGYDLLATTAEPEVLIGNKTFKELGFANTPKEAGTGYEKITITGANVKPEMGKVEVNNTGKTISWGALYWQYFEQLDQIKSAETGVKIKKQLYLQETSAKGNVLKLLTATNVLKPGDLIKVRIEIYADRDMEYVHLKDMRSSGFEPVNVISKYKYQDGLGYYETTKDASTNFFISYLRKGVYVFEYPLRVTHAGSFSNGITSLQSMYAPEFATHSQGTRITVK